MIEPHELKEPLICLSCEAEIESVADIQNHQPLRRGGIVICGHCASLHKVGDSALVKFTKQDFSKLDTQSKNLIAMTVISILKKKKENPQ